MVRYLKYEANHLWDTTFQINSIRLIIIILLSRIFYTNIARGSLVVQYRYALSYKDIILYNYETFSILTICGWLKLNTMQLETPGGNHCSLIANNVQN